MSTFWLHEEDTRTQAELAVDGARAAREQARERCMKITAEGSAQSLVRIFESGATRSPDVGRYDPEGYLSPIVLERFSEYMNAHRVQSDGSLRDSDNWQRGMTRDSYMKGLWRHLLHLWTRHRGYKVMDPKAAADAEEDLCALLFNVQGMLFEILKDKRRD